MRSKKNVWSAIWQVPFVLMILAFAMPAQAQKLLADGVKDLADQIAAKTKEKNALRVAVLPFYQIDGQGAVLGPYLAEELFTHLVNSGLKIVERALLDKALAEIELDQTGAITEETAKKLGSFLGSDAIVTGSITELQTQIAINCRLFDARGGSVFAAANTKIVKDDDVKILMKTMLPEARQAASKPHEGENERTPIGEGGKVQQSEASGLIVQLQPCKVSGTDAVCEFKVRTEEPDFGPLSCWGEWSRLVDDDGNEVEVTEIKIGNFSGSAMAEASLSTGVPIRGHVRFGGIRQQAKKASLIALGCFRDSERFTVEFRDVPLIR